MTRQGQTSQGDTAAALIEAGAQLLYPWTGRTDPPHPGDWEHTTVALLLAGLAPMIRADEQARHGHNCGGMWDEWTHDLRAKIEALSLMSDADWDYADGYEAAKRDVLDLFDDKEQ